MLSYNDLIRLVEDGVIKNVQPDAVNGSSIDVHLGALIITEKDPGWNSGNWRCVDIAAREKWASIEVDIQQGAYHMVPGEFLLGSTIEIFNLPPDISAEFRLKSSCARSGLDNSFACHCDPCWNGSVLTLELKNQLQFHHLKLTYGMPIGQMIFHRHAPVPHQRSYAVNGIYNGDATVSGVKL